jgi:hypothetical protein
MESEALFVTYPARAGEMAMVMPGVVGPAKPVPPTPPAPDFFEQPEQPEAAEPRSTMDRSAVGARALYKKGVRVVSVSLLVTLVLVCSIMPVRTARANGRFPAAQVVETVPGSDGSSVFLRTTFGILVSRDAGKSWHWVCERAFGYEGTWDPPIAVTRDGRLWVGLERGLVSTVDACRVDTATELAGQTVKDLTTDPKGETIWALTGAPDKRGAVWRRSIAGADAGAGKWERIGLVPEGVNPMTIEIAPSKPSRIYVSGQPFETIRGWLLRSDDGGKTFVGGKNELEASGPFFIAGVDPKDADRVLVRHLHTTGSDVLLSTDGGKTLKNVLSMKSAMFGFAKSADGSMYWAGSGLPEHGIYQSTDRGGHFERVSNHGVLCLHAGPGNRLFVCENPLSPDTPALALSMDHGKTVQALAKFADIQGPLKCTDENHQDAGAALCADAWAETRAQITPSVQTDAGTRPKRRPRDGGKGDGGDSADGGPDGAPGRRSACGCSVVGSAEKWPDLAWLTAGLIPLAMWSRPRRRPWITCRPRWSMRTHASPRKRTMTLKVSSRE